MPIPVLYRDRLIPFESVKLTNDTILYQDSDVIVTCWKSLKPRRILSYGYSCYYLKKGYKISQFYGHDNQFLYWYCDIISTAYDKDTDAYHFTDLLADVIVYPDGFVKVVDLEELSDALEKKLITIPQLQQALYQLSALLDIVYSGNLEQEAKPLLDAIPKPAN